MGSDPPNVGLKNGWLVKVHSARGSDCLRLPLGGKSCPLLRSQEHPHVFPWQPQCRQRLAHALPPMLPHCHLAAPTECHHSHRAPQLQTPARPSRRVWGPASCLPLTSPAWRIRPGQSVFAGALCPQPGVVLTALPSALSPVLGMQWSRVTKLAVPAGLRCARPSHELCLQGLM